MNINKQHDRYQVGSLSSPPVYPSTGWSKDLKRMPFFTRAEINSHISHSGKNVDPSGDSPCVQTNFRKATAFLNEEYLKDILTSSDDKYFYIKSLCHHSFKKNDPPHVLSITLCLLSGEVRHACCSCVAGKVGFCNHVLALMMKLCKFSLYDCRTVNDLDNEDDMQPKRPCTSQLQQWHHKSRGDKISPQAVMDVVVNKISQENSNSSGGIKCQLYEARNNLKTQKSDESKLKATLQQINPKIPLAQIMKHSGTAEHYVQTKYGSSPQGSYGSYQLTMTEDNFKVYCSIESVPRLVPSNSCGQSTASNNYPLFPLNSQAKPFELPPSLGEQEQVLLQNLMADSTKVNDIECKTREQSGCDEWQMQRKFRFTASNFGLIKHRKRNHDTLVKNLLHPRSFTSKYTQHGKKYEPVALKQYEKYMHSIKKPVSVYKSGFVISINSPYLGASPDSKVVDSGCTEPYGIVEVKCPETKFMVTPLDACSDNHFYLENVNGIPKLKENHNYYDQIQGQLGITNAKWCDFVVYTSKGMSIERITLDEYYWSELRETLSRYYFEHFLATAADEFCKC